MAYFICPNCGLRSMDSDGRDGLTHQAVGCTRCGFGFVFELLDDFYPGPDAGMLACDREARILAVGKGVFELTGFQEGELIGKDLREALGCTAPTARIPSARCSSGASASSTRRSSCSHRAGMVKLVRADLFPAYDEDGGLLACLAPHALVAATDD